MTAIAFVDKKHRFLMCNQTWCEMLNIPENLIYPGACAKEVLHMLQSKLSITELDLSRMIWDFQIHLINGKALHLFSIPVHTLDDDIHGHILQLTDMTDHAQKEKRCLDNIIALIGDRRKILIVDELLTGTKRFTALSHKVGFSAKVLTQHLRIMEERGLIHREAYNEVPLRVEYSLTELGRSLKPIFDAMWQWEKEHGHRNVNEHLSSIVEFIEDKRKILIVSELLTGTKRFTALNHKVGFSAKVLTQHLRIMEERGLIHRDIYNESPPRVEYSLTELGYSLKPIFNAMWQWEKER